MVPRILTLLCAIGVGLSASSQDTLDCGAIKTGNFTMRSGGAVVQIKRTEKYQMETAPGYKGKFRIRWESPCIYVLYDPKIKGQDPSESRGNEVRVVVTRINPHSYWATVSSNFDDRVDEIVVDF